MSRFSLNSLRARRIVCRNRVSSFVVVAACLMLGAVASARGQEEGAVQATGTDGPKFQSVIVVQLAVKDIDAAVKFYTKTLGLELGYQIDAIKWAQIKTPVPGFTLGIGEDRTAKGSGTASVNLAVADTDAVRKMLEERGVKFSQTMEIPGVVRLADFTDPDGNRLRLAGPPTGKPAQGKTEEKL
ncbi:MAG: VOC family protein [Planctomycetota bacterium]